MNVTIFSNNTKLKQNIESYTNDITIKQINNLSSFLEELLFLRPHLFIIDANEDDINTIYIKLKNESQLKDIPILFIVDVFNFNTFQKLGFNIGEVDYVQNPIEISQLISKLNSYYYLLTIKNKLTTMESFISQYSQSVIKGEMFSIISHQWRQPLNIIATAIINIELKSELEEIKHQDIESCVNKVHSTLEKTTNIIHNFEDIFKISLSKFDFDVNKTFLKAVNLILPQLSSHKIKITTNISKKAYMTTNFENELCQSILCLLSIIKDSIVKKYNIDSTFNGNIEFKIEEKENKIVLKIINKKIELSNDLFHNSLSLNTLDSSSTQHNAKLNIAKNIIEYKLNGNLNIQNDKKDVIFTIII